MRTLDAHAEGGAVRLVVAGFPAPQGRTMLDKQAWAAAHADDVRRALVLEPRGHQDLCAAALTEPVAPGSHAGLLFMDGGGFRTLSGHTIIAVTTIALERGLLMPGGDGATIVYDTPAGTVRARATMHGGRVQRVLYQSVPAFVLHAGLPVGAAGRHLRADIAFGGGFYAIVDSESAGVALDQAHVPELRRAGVEIVRTLEAAHDFVHPGEPRLRGLAGTVFTGPPSQSGADLRGATVYASGMIDRSPSGSGMAAAMAVVDAMGLLPGDTPFVHESLIGTRLRGTAAGRTTVGEYPAVVPQIEGSAWLTGEHLLMVQPDDPIA